MKKLMKKSLIGKNYKPVAGWHSQPKNKITDEQIRAEARESEQINNSNYSDLDRNSQD